MRPSDLGLPPRFAEFRKYAGFDQYQTALDIATSPERFQILNSATGSGKSVTATAVAALKQASRYLVLVGTKGLQAQWLGDGLVQRQIVGHRNYPCASRYGSADADLDDPEYRCSVPRERCVYVGDVEAAKAAKSVVGNYAYWLSIGRYSDPTLLGEFDFLVCDEAHSAASWLTNAVSIYITRNRLRAVLDLQTYPTLPKYAEVEGWHQWANDMAQRAYDRASRLGREDKSERRKVDRLIADCEMLARVSSPRAFADAGYKEPWIVIPFDDGNGVQFSPRWGSDFAEQYLFRGIKSVLLMSATIMRDHAQYLGVPQLASVSRYCEVPSPFDPRRRPVIWIPTVRVDYRMTDGAKYKLRQRVDEVIEAAIDQRAGNGVIHTGSYERTRELVAGSKYAPCIITHRQDAQDFLRALELFKAAGRAGKFAVIASPRMVEGVDLVDDLARWGVIIKVPFPDSRDPLTKARMKDAKYRDVVVAETIYQMVGRLVRNVEDFGTMLVLDNHWGEHVQWRCPFAAWFKAAFRTTKVGGGEKLEFLTHESVAKLQPVRQVEMIGAPTSTIQML